MAFEILFIHKFMHACVFEKKIKEKMAMFVDWIAMHVNDNKRNCFNILLWMQFLRTHDGFFILKRTHLVTHTVAKFN